jgi:hypothetical protein
VDGLLSQNHGPWSFSLGKDNMRVATDGQDPPSTPYDKNLTTL